jgi:hypothetical protein
MLAEDGLYIRRERDFSHTTYQTYVAKDTGDRDIKLADEYTGGLRKILKLSNDLASIADDINDLVKQTVKGKIGRARPPRISSTNFAAKIHNMVSQFLLAIKARVTVERSLAHIAEGRRVVVAVQNTMQSAIEALEHSGLPLNFNGLLSKHSTISARSRAIPGRLRRHSSSATRQTCGLRVWMTGDSWRRWSSTELTRCRGIESR